MSSTVHKMENWQQMSVWTAERIETLTTLWRDGRSGSEIANSLGGITRCAVLGKVFRLSLATRSPSSPPKAKRAPRRPVRAISPGPTQMVEPKDVEHTPPPAQTLPPMLNVTLAGLGPAMCRWPIGDPKSKDFRYCGLDQYPNHPSYCHAHACLSYQAPAQWRARAGWETRRHLGWEPRRHRFS